MLLPKSLGSKKKQKFDEDQDDDILPPGFTDQADPYLRRFG